MTDSPPSKKVKCSENGAAFELKCVNSIRAFSAELPQIANSGHPGAPMGCAPMAHLLWSEIMTYSPQNPKWWNRDRFVLSNGHACALLYSMLHLTGYNLTLEDCKAFRSLGSRTPGHPENFVTEGVEVSTGPLGQGICNAVGMAIGEKHLAATYNTPEHEVFSNHTYVICGDGCLQEGVSSEACSLAGHLGLGKLIVLYDDNNITIDGSTELSFTEDVGMRYESYGWQVIVVTDVETSLEGLRAALASAKAETGKPTMIKIKTTIGFGSAKENTHKVHGAPLGSDDMRATKIKFGLDPDKSFHIESDVREFYSEAVKKQSSAYGEWVAMYEKYTTSNPEKAKELERRFNHELPSNVFDSLPPFTHGVDKDLASRKFSESSLNALAPLLPELIGGSADLTPSNLTALRCSKDFQRSTPENRYLRFGVREHGMAAICNGLFAYGAFRPFCATFLNFIGYALGAVRLSALSQMGIIYIMTHDSIGLGEDGPTHQPVEIIESLRAMPNILVHRPSNAVETNASYELAIMRNKTPSVICCSRSTVKSMALSTREKALKGGYAVKEEANPNLIMVGTGSEVGICVEAAEALLPDIKVRVISMPCREIFDEQSDEYKLSILPGDVPTISVEAGAIGGWCEYAHYNVAMYRFGASGPGGEVFKKFGFSSSNLVAKGKELVKFYEGRIVPNLNDRMKIVLGSNEGH